MKDGARDTCEIACVHIEPVSNRKTALADFADKLMRIC